MTRQCRHIFHHKKSFITQGMVHLRLHLLHSHRTWNGNDNNNYSRQLL